MPQDKFIPQVFINADSDYGYNIVEFCNNLTDENLICEAFRQYLAERANLHPTTLQGR